MSIDDFCRCTPSEFTAVWTVWNEMHQVSERGQWERIRMQCLCSLQPWSKKTLEAHDIMPFPWEKEQKPKTPKISDEELKERYRAAKKAAGLK